MERKEAIEALKGEGFDVTERLWSLGDSICVAARPIQYSGIQAYHAVIYLYPNEGEWRVVNTGAIDRGDGRPDDRGFSTLAEAVTFTSYAMHEALREVR